MKIKIDGYEWDLEKAREIYDELDRIFGDKECYPLYPYCPHYTWTSTGPIEPQYRCNCSVND